MVHGDGSQTRTSTPTSDLVRRRFIDAGYAVLVWDKPGSGESIGEFDEGHTITQRAEILVDALEFLKNDGAVDAEREPDTRCRGAAERLDQAVVAPAAEKGVLVRGAAEGGSRFVLGVRLAAGRDTCVAVLLVPASAQAGGSLSKVEDEFEKAIGRVTPATIVCLGHSARSASTFRMKRSR